jgi:mono/diheme cytochrome c family protein
MRGSIEVSGPGTPIAPEPQPLFAKLGLDLDTNYLAENVPSQPRNIENGSRFAYLLPAYATTSKTYQENSPEQVWKLLRDEPSLRKLKDNDLWDVVYWLWMKQISPQKLKIGKDLFSTNCAACHGESGNGDGVIAREWPAAKLPEFLAGQNTEGLTSSTGLVHPPDFSKSNKLLGASPALLEGKIIRGGNGTGMPYWGPIFTFEQINNLVSFIYTFAWNSTTPGQQTQP